MSVSEYILNNIQNMIILKQEDAASIARAARALMLPPQAAGMLKLLDRGEAIVRVAAFPDPVMGKVTYVAPHRGPTSAATPQFDAVPAKRLAELPELRAALLAETGELVRAKKTAVETPGRVRAHVHDVIAEWVKQPGKPLVRIWKALGIDHPAKQSAIREALAPDFAELKDERFGSTTVAILEPTEAGYALVGRRVPEGRGRGKLVHHHGAWWGRDWAIQQGYDASLEWPVTQGGHPADVGYCVNGVWHVIEVSASAVDNLADAVRASLLTSQAVETVTIVTTMKSLHAGIRRRLVAAADLAPVLGRVHFSTFDFYLREVYG